MNQLSVWLDKKIEFIEDRLDSLEDSFEDIGSSLYLNDPAEVRRLITEDSDTYVINELYKLSNGDVQELGRQLARETFGCAVTFEFLKSLLHHTYTMSEVEDDERRRKIEQRMMQRATKKTYDCNYILDDEHY